MIPEQRYQPNQWVKYKYGSSQGISKIVGGIYVKAKGWMYTLVNPVDQKGTIMIKENDVLNVIE